MSALRASLFSSLVLGANAQPGLTGAPMNQFESYVLALEWQPSWSLDACPNGARPNPALIAHMSSPAGLYAREHLSLHGLWPNYNPMLHAGFSWPQFCDGRGVNYSTCVDHMSDAKCAYVMTGLLLKAVVTETNTSQ